jgi:2C-methyl-D-erythritol 2,4-cyclodiphosphate synthase
MKDFVRELRKDFAFTEAGRVLTQIRAEVRRKKNQIDKPKVQIINQRQRLENQLASIHESVFQAFNTIEQI